MISKGNLGLELHDSSLDSVEFAGQTCLIAMRPAYAYEIDAESGNVIGPCVVVDVVFEFDRGAVDGALGVLPDPILDGSLMVGSELLENLIPVPFECRDAVTMRLLMWPDDREIVVSARGLVIRLDGVPRLERGPSETVEVFGWDVDFQKVAFTKLLKSDLGYSLSEAKSATDAVVNNQRIVLKVGEAGVDGLLSKLNELGAKVVRKDQKKSSN
jgi:hypothetical protein